MIQDPSQDPVFLRLLINENIIYSCHMLFVIKCIFKNENRF